jgi:thioredoxin reductase (NADPH)
MESAIESILIYGLVAIFCIVVVVIYLKKQKKASKDVEEKIEKAKIDGLFEPVSLHPVVDPRSCIASGACIAACPEKDILGIRNGKATTINASHCIGHGACFHACPTKAITLVIGTEKRGVELPHVGQDFQTNVPGIYIAGELGGMGLIKNAVVQGRQAVENLAKGLKKDSRASYDLVIIGAGPAGIAASLTAKKLGLNSITLEQDTLGGTVFTFPRSKIVMTSAMDLPLYGKVKLFETSKSELLDLWKDVIKKHDINIKENSKVESIVSTDHGFDVVTLPGERYNTRRVLLAVGRRGTPRKLGIPGENLDKVAYRLLEPEDISGKSVVVVGGGDSAVESALLLCDRNKVILSYRNDSFSRLKPKNSEKIKEAIINGVLDVKFKTNLLSIEKNEIVLSAEEGNHEMRIKNDLVYIFAGGELPIQFLEKSGVLITKKYGEAILKH